MKIRMFWIAIFSLVLLLFLMTCVYGDPVLKERHKVWERITRIGINRNDCWCMFGDFNDLLHNGRKLVDRPDLLSLLRT